MSIVVTDNGSLTWYLDDRRSGSYSSFLAEPRPAESPIYDGDGDGSPGTSIKNGNADLDQDDVDEFQMWSWLIDGSDLIIDSPVAFDLWAAPSGFDAEEASHPYVYLLDCQDVLVLATCTLIAQGDEHIDDWNAAGPGFVSQQIDLGTVNYTVPAGRSLAVKLLFKHEDMWVVADSDSPSGLIFGLD